MKTLFIALPRKYTVIVIPLTRVKNPPGRRENENFRKSSAAENGGYENISRDGRATACMRRGNMIK